MAALMARAACTGIPEMTLTVALFNTRFACPKDKVPRVILSRSASAANLVGT
jgi:hypothetical protein